MLPGFSPFDSVPDHLLHYTMDLAQHTSAVQAKEALLESSDRMPTPEETKRVEACAAARVLGNLEAVCKRFRDSVVAVQRNAKLDMEMAKMATVEQAILDLARRNDLSDEQFEEKIISLLTGEKYIGIDFGKLFKEFYLKGGIVWNVVSSKIDLGQVQHIKIDGSDFGWVNPPLPGPVAAQHINPERLGKRDFDKNQYLLLAKDLIARYPGPNLSFILKRGKFPIPEHVFGTPAACLDNIANGVASMLEESRIVALDLSDYSFKDERMRKLVKAVGQCSTLRHLNLSGNRIGGKNEPASQDFIGSISRCERLESLELNDCGLDVAAMAAIVRATPKSTLAHLVLGNPFNRYSQVIGNKDGNEFAEAFSGCGKLSRLHLPMIIHAETILTVLKNLSGSSLAELALSGNYLTADQGEEAVQQLLKHHKTLTRLNWHNIGLGEIGIFDDSYDREHLAQNIKHFAEHLPKFTQLRVLNLSHNDLSDDRNVQAIADILPQCGLKELHLNSCEISLNGQITLAQAAANSKTLSYLSLPENPADRFPYPIMDIQRQNPQLCIEYKTW